MATDRRPMPMSFTAEKLKERLRELAADRKPPSRYLVGFSGGVDSAVLLHALVGAVNTTPIVAVHADHGLHSDSRDWDDRCARFAEGLGVRYVSQRIAVSGAEDAGVEAAARTARYAYFASQIASGDWLLSAHHADDQAETLLLNLLRGSGVLGLAGIAAARPLGQGLLVRPLLGVARAEIEDYARREGLDWIDDPSNTDIRFDRNFLRAKILPRLRMRWPAFGRTLARSAMLAGEASGLLDELAELDLARAGRAERLDLRVVRLLSPARQRNLLRFAVRRLGLPAPPATRLEQIVGTQIGARVDAEPLVTWPGAEVRRYRDRLYLLAERPAPALPDATLSPAAIVELGPGSGRLRLERHDGPGIDPAVAEAGLTVAFRAGGERVRIEDGGRTQKLKTLMQAAGIVPWMRSRIPLLMSAHGLVAVGDLWTDAASRAEPGYAVRWDDRPALD